MQTQSISLFDHLWRMRDLQSGLLQLGIVTAVVLVSWFISRHLQKHLQNHAFARLAEEGKPWLLEKIAYPFEEFPSFAHLAYVIAPLLAWLICYIINVNFFKTHEAPILHLAVIALGALAAARIVTSIVYASFQKAPWVIVFQKTITALIWLVVFLYVLGLIPLLIKFLDDTSLDIGKTHLSLWQVIKGVVLLITTVLWALWVSNTIDRRLSRTQTFDLNVRVMLVRTTRAILITLVVLICLPIIGIDLTMLSVFSGALGVGLGFGFQKIAANYISGFILLLDRSLRLGSVVSVNGHRGIVTNISTRYTVLKDFSGVEAIVPNETLVNSIVINEILTDNRILLKIPIQISYDNDLEKALAILLEQAQKHPRILHDPAPTALLMSFENNGFLLQLTAWVGNPQDGSAGVISDINLGIWQQFKTHNIVVPASRHEILIKK